MMARKLFFIFGLICVGLQAREIDTPDAKGESIQSFYQLPYYDEGGKIISEIVTRLATENKLSLGFKKGYMDRLGDQIEYKVHPLRFLGHIFSDPKLKNYMVTVRRDGWKWWGFIGSTKRRGVIKNMTREMHKHNIFPHLYGFSQHVGADYDRILFYVEREDYEGMVKYLIKH